MKSLCVNPDFWRSKLARKYLMLRYHLTNGAKVLYKIIFGTHQETVNFSAYNLLRIFMILLISFPVPGWSIGQCTNSFLSKSSICYNFGIVKSCSFWSLCILYHSAFFTAILYNYTTGTAFYLNKRCFCSFFSIFRIPRTPRTKSLMPGMRIGNTHLIRCCGEQFKNESILKPPLLVKEGRIRRSWLTKMVISQYLEYALFK